MTAKAGRRQKVFAFFVQFMELDEAAINEFKELYWEEYGIRLTDQEAFEFGARLIRFVKAVYGNNLPKPRAIDGDRVKDNN